MHQVTRCSVTPPTYLHELHPQQRYSLRNHARLPTRWRHQDRAGVRTVSVAFYRVVTILTGRARIEHSKLEFTLSLKVKRDPHIVAQMKANSQPARQPVLLPREVTPPPTKSRFNFFGSPKKTAKHSPRPSPAPAPMVPPKIEENLARYLKPDGSLARAFIAYKDVAVHCDTRLFETAIPLIGQRIDPDGTGTTMTTLPVGELVLQLFRLPPLHGVPPTQLPQSLDECLRGLRHVSWHKVTYFEGTLTQNGGDCVVRELCAVSHDLVDRVHYADLEAPSFQDHRSKHGGLQRRDKKSNHDRRSKEGG